MNEKPETKPETGDRVRLEREVRVTPEFIDAHMREQIRSLKLELALQKAKTRTAESKLLRFRRAYAEWQKLLLEP